MTPPLTAGAVTTLVAVLLLALVVRAMRWTEGLPAFDVEAQPLRQALRMWSTSGAVDWNPHFFVYPSLGFYFHLSLQWVQIQLGTLSGAFAGPADYLLAFETNPTAHVVVARFAVTLIDLATVLGTVAMGERLARGAGIAAGLVVALSPNGFECSGDLYVEGLLAACTVWAIERAVVHQRRGDALSLAVSSVLVGLATGCKYPGALLVLPLAWAAATAGNVPSGRRAGHAAAAIVLAGASFAVTSPYLLLDWGHAVEDLRFAGDLIQRGHLGNLGHRAGGFYAALLARDPGLLVLGLAAAAPFVAAGKPDTRRGLVVLALSILPPLATISLSSVLAPRYVVPVVPALAVCASVAAAALAARARVLRRPLSSLLAGALVVASVLPATWEWLARRKPDTRAEALAWCERSLPSGALVIRESAGPALFSVDRRAAVQATDVYRDASRPAQARFDARRTWNDVSWPLFVSGDMRANVAPDGAPPRWVQVVPEAVDFCAAFYDLRLLGLADFVITSSAVRSRYEADSVRFAVQVRAYRALDRDAALVARFAPDRGRAGPEVRIYLIPSAVRERWRSAGPELEAGWWLARVPDGAAIRREVPPDAKPLADGRPAWAGLLPGFHARHVEPTLAGLWRGLHRAGRTADAATIARLLDARP